MNRSIPVRQLALIFVAGLGLMLGGCGKPDTRGGGAPITGRASDPAVTFTSRWDETNHYVYRLDSITGTQVPRRNSDAFVQQDTTLNKDLRFGVTAITREGVRSLQMEIQAAKVETTSDQRLTSAFDTENELFSTEDNAIANRLRRVKGARLTFRLSPANKVLRVDGAKEFTDRVNNSGRSVRGAANTVLNKFFGQQFYRDLVEMSFLPTNPVRIGESWTISLRSGPGLFNNSTTDLTYTFRGWQVHEGTNCARFDFVGGAKTGSPATSPAGRSSNAVPRGVVAKGDTEIEGTVWFSPEMGVPVEMIIDQSTTRQTTTTRTARPANAPGATTVTFATARPGSGSPTPAPPPGAVVVETEDDTEGPATLTVTNMPTPPPGVRAAPAAPTPPASSPAITTSTTTRTTTTKQHAVLTLVELVPVEAPPQPK